MVVEGPAVRCVLATHRRDQLDHFLSVLLGHGNPQRMGLSGTPVHIPYLFDGVRRLRAFHNLEVSAAMNPRGN